MVAGGCALLCCCTTRRLAGTHWRPREAEGLVSDPNEWCGVAHPVGPVDPHERPAASSSGPSGGRAATSATTAALEPELHGGAVDWVHFASAWAQDLDLEGRLITCEHGRRAVSRTNSDGSVEVLVDRYKGGRLNSPNDVVVKSDGTIWFTDPEYGIQDDLMGYEAPNEQDGKCYVFRFDPASGELSAVADDFVMPNGLAFSADESLLYIVDSGGDKGLDLFAIPDELPDPHEIRVFDVIGGRRLENGRLFTKVSPGVPDGIRLDSDGNVWSVAFDGVHCYSPAAELLGKIKIPEMVANITFGGPERNRLFIAAANSLYAADLDRQGIQRP